MFCQRCTEIIRQLRYDPAAVPFAELLTGSCIWRDEYSWDWCSDCDGTARQLFNLRYRMTVGESLPQEAIEIWKELERVFPDWPLFRPERRSPEIADKVERMVRHCTNRAIIECERYEREQQRDGQAGGKAE
jgi:hypothetical protein